MKLIPHLFRIAHLNVEQAWRCWFEDETGAAVFATREGPSTYIDEDPPQDSEES